MTEHPNSYAQYARTAHVGRCEPCDKETYLSRKAARRRARTIHPGEHLNAYRCPATPQHWHLGHLAPPVIDGTSTKGAWYRR